MTRERAIEEVKNYENFPNGISKECRDYIIKALDQEPCNDSVSRKELIKQIDILDNMYGSDFYWNVRKIVDSLTPVTPKGVTVTDFADRCLECGKQRKGKWIEKENIQGLERYYECSNCGNHCLYEYVEIGFKNAKTNYCPHCGAKMTAGVV